MMMMMMWYEWWFNVPVIAVTLSANTLALLVSSVNQLAILDDTIDDATTDDATTDDANTDANWCDVVLMY